MKQYIFLLFSLFLAACAEKDISGVDGPTGPNSGLRLSVRLSLGVATRALGDPFASGKEEKRIDRLAFFVHTAEDGFQVYPPVPDDVTDPDVAAADHPNAVYLSGTPDDAKAARLQYAWHTLYTYPNSDTEHAPTALEIKGTFRGTEITRQIPFVDKDGNAFPVEGNHRYLVRIVKAPGQTDISYSIAVSEWDAVDTVQVKPDQTAVPEITKLDCNGVYVEKEKRYDVYYKVDGLLTFDATCNFSAGVRVKYYDNKNETWTTQGDWVKVEKTAETPVTKVIAGYKSSFKVTFYKFDTGVSRKAMLLVHNGGSEVECDTIFIKHTITYPGTDLEPVALGNITGKDIVWAPVNVGATRLPTTAYNTNLNLELNSEELQTKIEERGLLFQWGRKYGIAPTLKVLWVSGMINMEELQSNFGFKDKLINGSGENGVDADWLTPSDNTLWGNGITKGVYDPCPEGWRVPSKEELQVLADKANIDGIWDNSDCNLSFSDSELVFSENVGVLYMTVWNDITTFPDRFSIWSYSVDNGTQGAFYFNRSGESYKLSQAPRSSAIPVRCVQE